MPGVRVLLLMANSVEMAVVAFALSQLGAIWIPLNTALKGNWLTDVVTRARSSVLVVDAELLAAVEGDQLPGVERLVVVGASGSQATEMIRDYDAILGEDAGEPAPDRDYREVTAVMWTSGTTGAPKGVMQTHSSWLLGSHGLSGYRDFRDGDVLYCCLPMFNSGGWSLHVIGAMIAGLTVAIDPTFSASRFWERCRFYRATQILTLGAMYDFLLQTPPSTNDREHSVRVAACIPIPPGRQAEFMERFGIPAMWSGYAQSEFLWMFGRDPYQIGKPGSCGVVNDSVQVAILDPDDRPVPTGDVGEICARPNEAHLMFAGYFDDPELTLTATRNLWYHTGDLGFIDEDGELFFADRKTDVVRFGGRSISAAEVERAALAHPDVQQAAAVGVVTNDLDSEAEVMLTVVAKRPGLDPSQLARFINDTAPHYLVPRFITVVESLPMTPTGKIEKHALRSAGVTDQTWDRTAAGFLIEKVDSWAR
ncbi:MAG: AMP-binding protein [Acidimicrobiia bacterium]